MEESGIKFAQIPSAVIEQIWHQVKLVFSYPVTSNQRIYFLYIAMALIFSLFIYSRSRTSKNNSTDGGRGGLLEFLFPAAVWKSPSAWLDVRYFFFHQAIFVSIFGWLGMTVTDGAVEWSTSWLGGPRAAGPVFTIENQFVGGIVYMFVLFAIIDFVSFLIHFMQHKVSWLWAFHKVHHSATVMHPLTNYREHPLDNLLYVVGTGAVTGLVAGLSIYLIGGVLRTPTILGVSLLAFLFNFLAYNLRHSHIWLRWPGCLNYVFGCPAHHQVHHSCHPEHIDRNFAFMFPVWDLVIGTYCLPETNKDVVFGLGNGEEKDFRSCLGLYLVPFRKLMAGRGKSIPENSKT